MRFFSLNCRIGFRNLNKLQFTSTCESGSVPNVLHGNTVLRNLTIQPKNDKNLVSYKMCKMSKSKHQQYHTLQKSSVVDPDPHHFGNLDPHPHQIKIRIRIRIKVISWIRNRIRIRIMNGIWAYFSTFSRVWAFLWIRAASASGWKKPALEPH